MTAPKRRNGGVATTIGGILVGFDEQVWSQRPPAQEQVAKTDQATRIPMPGGRLIELPSSDPTREAPGSPDEP